MTITPSSSIAEAQHDMREAYLDGGVGVLVSATAWCVAGLVCLLRAPQAGVWALFIGGALIHPLSVLLLKACRRSGAHASGNPMGTLAIASTFWLILSLPLAYGVAVLRMDLFFPAMLFVIAGRYLVFSTIYGLRLYWVFGIALALAGYGLALARATPAGAAFAGAAIEAVFGLALLAGARKR